MDKVLVITLAVSCLPLVNTYSSGAPPQACEDMFPKGHGVESQQSKAPYFIRVSQTVHKPNSTFLQVEISANSGESFAGFFLQARSVNCEKLVGNFILDFKDFNDTKYVECNNTKMAAVTHNMPAKRLSKRFTWFNSEGGDVYFQATFVRSFMTFWTGVKSVVVRDHRTLNMTSDLYPAPCPNRITHQKVEFPYVSWGDGTVPLPEMALIAFLALTLYLL